MAKEEIIEKIGFSKIQDDLTAHLNKQKFAGKLWVRLLIFLIIVGTLFYMRQLVDGLGITAMRDYSAWGMYIGHFVFLVAVSLVGSLVTAILKLLDIKWATPITRISEMIAVAAVIMAAVTIIIDMGRPDRVYHLFLHPRISSPILWDVMVVNTYLVISLILLYLPLIPDIAILRDRQSGKSKLLRKVYGLLALGWKGTKEQYKILKRNIRIMCILILPVAFAIHTVTSWLFAVNSRAGWNSTIFGPYFVSGAFVVGAAAVILAMYIYRRSYKLHAYITPKHFSNMGKLLVLTALVYLYFNINEYLVPGYKMQRLEGDHLLALLTGHEAPIFWATQLGGLVIPILLLLIPYFRKPGQITIISVFVILGAWLKRLIIVIPTQFHPQFPIQNVPESFKHYVPTLAEIAITVATVAGVLVIITILSRLFPVIPIWEVAKEHGHEKELIVERNEEKGGQDA